MWKIFVVIIFGFLVSQLHATSSVSYLRTASSNVLPSISTNALSSSIQDGTARTNGVISTTDLLSPFGKFGFNLKGCQIIIAAVRTSGNLFGKIRQNNIKTAPVCYISFFYID